MADEITMQVYLTFDKNGIAAFDIDSGNVSVDVTGNNAVYNIQDVGTSAENLVVGDVGTAGFIIAHNLDATNFVEIGYDDTGFVSCTKLKAGEWQLFRMSDSASTPQAKFDTGAGMLEYYLIEE
jgi:hypothetical protein